MEEKLFNRGFIFALVGLFAGAFYREFTKFIGFTGETVLSLVHPHFLLLGFVFMVGLMLLIRVYNVEKDNRLNKLFNFYTLSVILTGGTLFARGMTEALEMDLSRGADMSISGIAGIGHIILGVSLYMILKTIKGYVKKAEI